jgi:AAA ATPase domain
MKSELNPYAPGSGLRPPAMTGRDRELESFEVMIARTKNHLHNRGMILSGLRGVGKTVLLNSLMSRADEAGWFTVGIEGQVGATGAEAVREELARELLIAARNRLRPSAKKRFLDAVRTISSFSATIGISGATFGFERRAGRADSGRIEIDLKEMIEDIALSLKDDGVAFAIFIDEMQDLDKDLLVALVSVQHAAGQRDWPFYIIGAGLPNLPAKLSEARSYAERLFNYRQIGPLPTSASKRALEEPAAASSARFETEALNELVEAAAGYPYFIQEFGRSIWDLAPATPFTGEDARLAITLGREQLDAGFFPSRWERATKTERHYLRAMAEDGDEGSSTGAVAERLGLSQSTLGPVRAGLIAKGLVYSPGHGEITFTVPGMAAFIQRRCDDS